MCEITLKVKRTLLLARPAARLLLLLAPALLAACTENPWLTPTPPPSPPPPPMAEISLMPPEMSPSAAGRDRNGNPVAAVAGERIRLTPRADGLLNLSVPVSLARGVILTSFSDPVSGAVLTGNSLGIPIRDVSGKITLNLVATVRPLVGTGAAAEGLVEKLELQTQPLVADLSSSDPKIGTVSFQIKAELNSLPEGAGIRIVLARAANPAAANAFNLAVSRIGNQIKETAFVSEVTKTRLVDGKDIGPGTVTLAVGKSWADAVQLPNVAIIVLADDGSVEILRTQFVRYNEEEQAVFTAISRKGVSTFGLVALLNPTPTPTPAPAFFQLRVINDTPGFGAVLVEPANPNSRYLMGTTVILRAVANQGRKFEYWAGDAAGTNTRVEVVMDADKTVTAVFGTLTFPVNADPFPAGSGVVEIQDNLGQYLAEYDYGTRVTLRATPSRDFVFRGWSGDVTSNANPLTITVDGPKNITANFSTIRYNFISSVNPPGAGTVSPPTGTLDVNTVVSLAATPFQGYVFAFWSGDASGTSNPVSIRMDRNRNMVANFTRAQYRLTAQAQPFVGGSVTPSGGVFEYGQTVTLTANPGSDYFFNGWSGDISGSQNPRTITMTKDTVAIATFVQKRYPLNVHISPQGSGFISPAPSGVFPIGTQLELAARPAPGYRFVSWTGDLFSSSPLISVVMDRPIFLTANFEFVQPTPSPTPPTTVTQ